MFEWLIKPRLIKDTTNYLTAHKSKIFFIIAITANKIEQSFLWNNIRYSKIWLI